MIRPIRDTFAVYKGDRACHVLEVHYWKVSQSEFSERIEAIVFEPGKGLVPAYILEGFMHIEEAAD